MLISAFMQASRLSGQPEGTFTKPILLLGTSTFASSEPIGTITYGGQSGDQRNAIRLTGLPDRDAMQSRIIQLLEERQPFTVAVADIDDFGTLNAQHGRAAGDRALQTAALVSRRTIRPEDVVGRIGGDELLLLLPRTSAADAGRALERLREELVLELSNAACPAFTLSMGVIASDAAATIEDVLHKAAAALAHARADGGNRVVVADSATSPPEPATR